MSGRRKTSKRAVTETDFCGTNVQTPAMRTRSKSRLATASTEERVGDQALDLSESPRHPFRDSSLQVTGLSVGEVESSVITAEASVNLVDLSTIPGHASQLANRTTGPQMGNTLPDLESSVSLLPPCVVALPTIRALTVPQQTRLTFQHQMDPIDVETLHDSQPACIDLTNDDNIIEVVDLTSPALAPAFQSVDGDRRVHRPRRHTRVASPLFGSRGGHRPRRRAPIVSVDSPPSSLTGSHKAPLLAAHSGCISSPGPSSTAESVTESKHESQHEFICPICLDSATTIKQSGRQIYSTVCGHVFCRNCLMTALKASGVCPSCRKTIRPSQAHPLYI